TWMIETDIASFYPSLDHVLIGEMLKRRGWLNSDILINLLLECLSKWSVFDDANSGQGVPVGYETSELLATLFLLDIDLTSNNPPPIMRRFVDDMYIFFPTEKDMNQWFRNYDLALKKRALTINSAKTNMSMCNSSHYNEEKFRRNMRGKISYIKNIQPLVDEEVAQQELIALFHSNIKYSDDYDLTIQSLINNLSIVTFILWRLTIRDEKIKQVALWILDKLPDKSLHATEYLSHFYADDEVILKLTSIVDDRSSYTTCKIDCIKGSVSVSVEIQMRRIGMRTRRTVASNPEREWKAPLGRNKRLSMRLTRSNKLVVRKAVRCQSGKCFKTRKKALVSCQSRLRVSTN
ncbi:MAG: RNA-directed DNA polymerase, partial [Phototrophicaceae bacterium]